MSNSRTHHGGPELAVTVAHTADEPGVTRDLHAFETVTRAARFTCSSGDRFGGEWRGVPLSELLPVAALPQETTHLTFASADGFRVCLPVSDALDGLLAVEDGHGPLDSAPRLVASGIDGARTAKRVARIAPAALAPDESPEDYENVGRSE